MSKEMGVILLGLLNIIIATNLLGVPASWRMVILVLSGLGLMVLGFMLRNEVLARERGSARHPFTENSHEHLEYEHAPAEPEHRITSLN